MGDLMKVYEIGPVFRSEKSFTHRHLCEFIGLDMEMAFKSHYHEVLDVIDQIFINIFEGINKKYQKELEIISSQYPFKPIRYSKEKNLRLQYKDAIILLNEDAEIKNKDIVDEKKKIKILGKTDDIDTTNEKRLGAIVAEKYETDFYILDKFPLCLRPFYTMPDPE
jgi:aspartyl-tRNA synthetase